MAEIDTEKVCAIGAAIEAEALRMGLSNSILMELSTTYFTAFGMLDDEGKRRVIKMMNQHG